MAGGLVGVVLAALMLVASAGDAAAGRIAVGARVARAAGPVTLSAEVKGVYEFEDTFASAQGIKLNTKESFRWDETLTEIVDGSTGAVLTSRLILDAEGHIHQDGNSVNPKSEDCDIRQLKVPKDIMPSIDIQPWLRGGKVVGYGAGFNVPDTAGTQVRVTGNNQNCDVFDGNGALLSDTASVGTVNNVWRPGDPEGRKFTEAFGITVQPRTFAKLPFEVPEARANQTGKSADENASRSISVHATLGGKAKPITPPPSPKPSTTPAKIRLEILTDIRAELPPAIWWCGVLGAGVGVIGTTGPVIGIYIGYTLIGIAGPMCKLQLDVLRNLAKGADDPPVGNYTQVAAVHPTRVRVALGRCPTSPSTSAALCAKLRSLADSWRTATENVDGIARALATTVGRESAAAAAGNAAALKLQQRAGLALVPKLASAVSAQRRTAKATAMLLRAHGASAGLTAVQTSKTLATIKSGLHGLPARDIQLVTATAPTGSIDLLALLGAAAPKPLIASVTFSGTVQSPSIVIHGRNLGKMPAPDPTGSPSNRPPLCPVTITGNAGLDYGTSLYIADDARKLAAGRYRPGINELDCVGLIVTKFTPSEVEYRLGSYYSQVYPQYPLAQGDAVEVGVNGATKTIHVTYGATVTS